MQPRKDPNRLKVLMEWAAMSYIILSLVYFGGLLVYLNVFASPSYVYPPGFAAIWTAISVVMIFYGVFALALYAFFYQRRQSFLR